MKESVNHLLILDTEDEYLRGEYKWVLHNTNVLTYRQKKRIWLTRLVTKYNGKSHVYKLNDNIYDFRKENLRIRDKNDKYGRASVKANGIKQYARPERKAAVKKRSYARWVNNREKLLNNKKIARANYSEEKRAELREKARLKAKEKRKNDPIYCIIDSIRSSLRRAIKKNQKQSSATKDLGCSLQELKAHLESKFYTRKSTGEVMSWENYGSTWHLDHIIALANFDMSKKEEQLKAVHYTNLQPLWKEDNLRKGAKTDFVI